MFVRTTLIGTLVALVAGLVGCSGSSGAGTGIRTALNLSRKDSNLRLYLDGQEAKQSKLKKGLTGYAPFKLKESVGTSPVFRYEIIEPKEFGYIKRVSMQIHQKYEADFSDIADYVIFPVDKEDSFKPDTDYDLADLGDDFKILDRHDDEVETVEFKPGWEYLLVFTVQADQSESVQIYFKTK